MAVSFTYGVSQIKDLKVILGKSKTRKNKIIIDKIVINRSEVSGKSERSEDLPPVEALISKRFWKSLHQRFRFSDNIYKYFDHHEVYERITQKASNSKVRWCVEKIDDKPAKLLAITNPDRPYISAADLMQVLGKGDTKSKDYNDGVVRSTHTPRIPWHFTIGGDPFVNQFIVDTPIDGFGKPNIYVSLLGQNSGNNIIGYAPEFRTELNVGKKEDAIEYTLARALESFNNEDAYAAIKERVESGIRSWTSVYEAMQLHKTLVKVYSNGGLKGIKKLTIGGEEGNTWDDVPVMREFSKLTGDLNRQYGLSNIDALSVKKQRTLPASCTVYSLINFTTNVASHHATPAGNRALQAFIGKLLVGEYDLEGTVDYYKTWKDFFLEDKAATETMAEIKV